MIKIAFIGAGSVQFTRELLRDLSALPDLPPVRVALYDIDPDRLAVARTMARDHEVTATTDRRAALDGADFVVNMVAIGGHPATLADFDVPERHGLRQTIGDTLGIGGIFRGLRTFPFLFGLAADMLAVCPDAWLLNYTNPMAMNVQYLGAVAPRLKVLGLCHSVHWTVVDLSRLVGVPIEEVTYWSAGVNHQAWILRLERSGEDLYPRLDDAIARDPELARRVRVDMYRRLGFYPTETSEHSAEYVPWYLARPAEISRLRIPVRDYVRISAANLAEYERMRAGDIPPATKADAIEYAPQVIHSLVTGTPRLIQATTPNAGLIGNLPAGAAVETPCVLDRSGAHPVHVGDLPPQLAALNRAFLSVAELTVAAALEEDPRRIRQAAMVDPSTAAALTVDEIWRLCDDMVEAHAPLLPPAMRVPLSPKATAG